METPHNYQISLKHMWEEPPNNYQKLLKHMWEVLGVNL